MIITKVDQAHEKSSENFLKILEKSGTKGSKIRISGFDHTMKIYCEYYQISK